jgi:hypothetical protein
MHALDDTHDTLARPLPAVLGVGWSDQRLPFQRSTNPPPGLEDPTATHAVGDKHETPLREDTAAPRGVGVASSDQRLPSQRSISGVWGPSIEGWKYPTATHAVGEAHETALRYTLAAVAPAGSGVL